MPSVLPFEGGGQAPSVPVLWEGMLTSVHKSSPCLYAGPRESYLSSSKAPGVLGRICPLQWHDILEGHRASEPALVPIAPLPLGTQLCRPAQRPPTPGPRHQKLSEMKAKGRRGGQMANDLCLTYPCTHSLRSTTLCFASTEANTNLAIAL